MEVIKFIAWADTHWDKLASKCVTLEDTEKVERAIFERARTGGFDFTLFAGDRYLKREPDDECKVRADRVIYDHCMKSDIMHYHLIGNHDWVDNSRRWHTSESLKMHRKLLVMDQAATYRHGNVRIHALPADFPMDMSKYEFERDTLNIFVFHDTVAGTYMNEEKSLKFEHGMSLEEFDKKEFDIVLAGDIHIRQPFQLVNTHGGYLGSVVQRTRADAGVPRGWTEVTAENMGDGWTFEVKFVPTKNLFTRVSFQVDRDSQFKDLVIPKEDVVDQLVEVKLVGDKADVDRIAEDPGWALMEDHFKARRIELLRAYQAQESELVVDLTKSDSTSGDLELYLESQFASIGNLNREEILQTVKELSGEVS